MCKILGAQLYTVRDFAKTPKEIDETLKKISEIGYTTIQASGIGAIPANELKVIADSYGLKIILTHTGYDRFKNDLDGVIKDHHAMGCGIAGLGMIPHEFKSEEGYLSFSKDFNDIACELAKNGLKFSYHNHKLEFEKYGNRLGMDILADETNPENFLFTLDTYWVQAGGADPVQWIKKLNGRIDAIHFKDMAIKDDNQIMSEVLEGNLNWREIFKACEETAVKWYMVEQDVCQRNPFESLKISYDNLKKEGFR